MPDLFEEKAFEEATLGVMDHEATEKAAYDSYSALYEKTNAGSFDSFVQEQRYNAESEDKSMWETVGKVLDFALTPLGAAGAGILAPIGHEFKEEGAGALWEGAKVSGEAFVKTLIPGYGDDENRNYAREVVDKFGLGDSELQKTSVSLGLDLLADPTIIMGLPLLKVFQKGIRGVRGLNKLNTAGNLLNTEKASGVFGQKGVWEDGLTRLLGDEVSEEGKNLIGLAKQADTGNAEDAVKFFKEVEVSEEVKNFAKLDDMRDLNKIYKDAELNLGIKGNDLGWISKNVKKEDLIKASQSNEHLSRLVNYNHLKISTRPEAENAIGFLLGKFGDDYERSLKGLSFGEKKLFDESQKVLLQDLVRTPIKLLDGKDIYKAKELLKSTMYDMFQTGAKHDPYSQIKFNQLTALSNVLLGKVLGGRRAISANFYSLRHTPDDKFGSVQDIKKILDTVSNDPARAKLMKKLSGQEFNPSAILRLVEAQALSPRKKFFDTAHEIWINSILSAPITHAVNLTSTASRLALEPLTSMSASVSALARFKGGQAVEHFQDAYHQVTGMMQGFIDGMRLGTKQFSGGRMFGDFKYPVQFGDNSDLAKIRYDPAITPEKFGATGAMGTAIGFMGRAVRVPGSFLMGEDRFMKMIAFRMDVNKEAAKFARRTGRTFNERRQLYRAIKKDPMDSLKQRGIKTADEVTFHTRLGKNSEKFNSWVKTTPGMRWMIPFFRTPTNLVHQGLRHTPFGALYGDLRKNMFEATAVGDLARAKLAMGPMMAGGLLSLLGENVTGRVDMRTPSGKFQQNEGAPGYSIGVNGNWFSYEKIEPLRFMIGTAVSLRDIMTNVDMNDPEEEPAAKAATDAFIGILLGTATDNYMLQQVGQIYGMLWSGSNGDSAQFIKSYQNILASFVPNFMAQWKKQKDGYYTIAETFMDKVKKRIPGINTEGYYHRNAYGEEINIPHGWGPDFINPLWNNYVSPIRMQKFNYDNVSKTIIDSGANIQGPIKDIKGMRLTLADRDRVNKLSGIGPYGMPSVKESIADLINSGWWSSMSPKGKQQMIQNTFKQYRKLARDQVFYESDQLQMEFQRRQRLEVQ